MDDLGSCWQSELTVTVSKLKLSHQTETVSLKIADMTPGENTTVTLHVTCWIFNIQLLDLHSYCTVLVCRLLKAPTH